MHQTQPEPVSTSLTLLYTEYSDLFETATLPPIKGFKAHLHIKPNSNFKLLGWGRAWSVGVPRHNKQGGDSRDQHDADRTCAEAKRSSPNLRRLQSISQSVPGPYSVSSTAYRRSIRTYIQWSSFLQARSIWCIPSGWARRRIKASCCHHYSPMFVPVQSFLLWIIISTSNFLKRIIQQILRPVKGVQPYLDDIALKGANLDDHLRILRHVCRNLCQAVEAQTREMCVRSTFYQVPRSHFQRRWSSTWPWESWGSRQGSAPSKSRTTRKFPWVSTVLRSSRTQPQITRRSSKRVAQQRSSIRIDSTTPVGLRWDQKGISRPPGSHIIQRIVRSIFRYGRLWVWNWSSVIS